MKTPLVLRCTLPAIFLLLVMTPARPNGVAFNVGDVFAADSGGTIFHYSSNFTLLDTLNTGLGGFQTGMAFDTTLNLYTTNFTNNSITKFSPAGNIVTPNPFVTNDSGAQNESIVFNGAGEFFVGQPDATRDIIKRAAAGTFISRYDVATGPRGSDWVELAADQKTIFYTSEGNVIYRFDTSTNTQLANFATLPAGAAFALRFLPNGELLVAESDRVVRLNSSGTIVKTYFPAGASALFALNVEPNGTTFLTADIRGTIYRIDIASGTVLTTFTAGSQIFGLAVAGELTNSGGGPSKIVKLSTRGQVGKVNNYLLSTFTIGGTDPTKVIVRALGPSLRTVVPDFLRGTVLQLYDSHGTSLGRNDDWRWSQEAAIVATGLAPTDDEDSAIVLTLQPGTYAATLTGLGEEEEGFSKVGVGLLEVYDLVPAANSTLPSMITGGFVGTGSDVLIGGLTIGGGTRKTKVLIRAIGPSVTGSGVLQDPTLELANSQGSTILFNDNWQDTQKAAIQATGLAPSNNKESAIIADLDPGSYVGIMRGKNNTTGKGRVEIYQLP